MGRDGLGMFKGIVKLTSSDSISRHSSGGGDLALPLRGYGRIRDVPPELASSRHRVAVVVG
jgi:hypothetical protein